MLPVKLVMLLLECKPIKSPLLKDVYIFKMRQNCLLLSDSIQLI